MNHLQATVSPPPVKNALFEEQPTKQRQRIISIDVLRALTMILMIFVNDLWSLKDIPAWLGHVESGVDGIGLADIVFPAFLFIVGLSLPFAIDNRKGKGDSNTQLLYHVLWRTLALLIMGVFLVNGETLNASATGMPRYVWNPVCCLCFIILWNGYPERFNKIFVYGLRIAAVLTLLFLAVIYRGGSDDNLHSFGPQWWGILGLIGWAYLVSAVVTVYAKNKIGPVIAAWAFFAILSMLSHAGSLPGFLGFIPDPILGGTLTGLTLGGVLTALIFQYYRQKNDNRNLTIVLMACAALCVVLSLITRPYWGLAKLGATPAWLFLCSAFTIIGFVAVYWLVDVYGKKDWFTIIRPAGTATLLCYLIPYFAYATTRLLGIHLPEILLTGGIGLMKSIAFALLCAVITGVLLRGGMRFKV